MTLCIVAALAVAVTVLLAALFREEAPEPAARAVRAPPPADAVPQRLELKS